MRLLKLMILPLVIASLITGSASLNAKVSCQYFSTLLLTWHNSSILC